MRRAVDTDTEDDDDDDAADDDEDEDDDDGCFRDNGARRHKDNAYGSSDWSFSRDQRHPQGLHVHDFRVAVDTADEE